MPAFMRHPKNHEDDLMELSGYGESPDSPQPQRDMQVPLRQIGFFCETKNPTSLVEKQLRRCGFTGVFCVDPLGRAGGVAIGWKEQAKVSIIRHGQYFIIFSVSDDSLQ